MFTIRGQIICGKYVAVSVTFFYSLNSVNKQTLSTICWNILMGSCHTNWFCFRGIKLQRERLYRLLCSDVHILLAACFKRILQTAKWASLMSTCTFCRSINRSSLFTDGRKMTINLVKNEPYCEWTFFLPNTGRHQQDIYGHQLHAETRHWGGLSTFTAIFAYFESLLSFNLCLPLGAPWLAWGPKQLPNLPFDKHLFKSVSQSPLTLNWKWPLQGYCIEDSTIITFDWWH